MKKPGETMMFTGGAEETPCVMISTHHAPGAMTHNDPTLVISQGDRLVRLSPETMKAILEWYES